MPVHAARRLKYFDVVMKCRFFHRTLLQLQSAARRLVGSSNDRKYLALVFTKCSNEGTAKIRGTIKDDSR
jgi:hypothetical protein